MLYIGIMCFLQSNECVDTVNPMHVLDTVNPMHVWQTSVKAEVKFVASFPGPPRYMYVYATWLLDCPVRAMRRVKKHIMQKARKDVRCPGSLVGRVLA